MTLTAAKWISKDGSTIDDDGSGQLEIKDDGVDENKVISSALGTGLTGGSGSALIVDTASTVTFSGAVWTFPTDELQVTGTPDSANDAVNKAYVDNVATGLQWVEPADVNNYIGNAAFATLNGLSPNAGDAYVLTDAGTLTRGAVGVVAGDLVQDDGTNWSIIVTNSGNFPPAGTRALAAADTGTALISPLTDNTDNTKYCEWAGASLTPALSSPSDGDAILIAGEGSYWENNGFVYDGSVPTGAWIQFTGAGQVNAGAGLTKSGNTLDVGDAGKGVQVNADDLEVDASEIAGDGIKVGASSELVALDVGGLTNQMTTLADADEIAVESDGNSRVERMTYANLKTNLNADLNVGQDKAATLTLDGTDISNKYKDLSGAESVKYPSATILNPEGGPRQTYTTDYTVITDGSYIRRINWNGLGLDGVLSSGDKLVISYEV